MKTTITIPDEISASADALAKDLGLSRSELYARAIAAFLTRHRDAAITAKLDAVYAEEPSGLDDGLWSAQARSTDSGDW